MKRVAERPRIERSEGRSDFAHCGGELEARASRSLFVSTRPRRARPRRGNV
jgi:hypothetical protein